MWLNLQALVGREYIAGREVQIVEALAKEFGFCFMPCAWEAVKEYYTEERHNLGDLGQVP